jgi:hypothetical protein
MVIEIVAVLDASVPVLLLPTALTEEPVIGLIVTVMAVPRGKFEQFTTTGIGLDCCAETTASGVDNTPVGDAETGTPPTLVTVSCANWPADGIIIGWKPEVNWP